MVLQRIKSIMKESPYMMKTIARLYRLVHYNNAWKYRIWGDCLKTHSGQNVS